jgi:hypothetical protein
VENRIRKHVESSEFYKEVARLSAVAIIAASSLDEMLHSPALYVDNFLAALLDVFDGHRDGIIDEARSYAAALGLVEVPLEDANAIADDAERGLLTDSRDALSAALIPVDDRISEMLDSGISAETISKSFESDATRDALLSGFIATARGAASAWVNDIDRGIAEAAADAIDEAAAADAAISETQDDEPPNFEWLAVIDGRTCDDQIENSCAPRHGVVMTMSEWEEMGRPGAPNLICSIFSKTGSSCRCLLLESGKTGRSEVVNPVDVSEAIKAGRDRAARSVA